MIPVKATEWLLFFVLCVLVLWEMAVVRWGEPGATISDVMNGLAKRFPEVPLFIGLVVGHWFWSCR